MMREGKFVRVTACTNDVAPETLRDVAAMADEVVATARGISDAIEAFGRIYGDAALLELLAPVVERLLGER